MCMRRMRIHPMCFHKICILYDAYIYFCVHQTYKYIYHANIYLCMHKTYKYVYYAYIYLCMHKTYEYMYAEYLCFFDIYVFS